MKEFTCIVCPRGCQLSVENEVGEIKVTGNACPRGKKYGETEYTNPVRNVSFNVKVVNGKRKVVSVKTAEPVPVGKILPMSRLIRNMSVSAPVKIGDEVLGSSLGVKMVVTANVDKE